MADLVKLSDEDAALLAPDRPVDRAGGRDPRLQARAVIVTAVVKAPRCWRAGQGAAVGGRADARVVDTIGAGEHPLHPAGLSGWRCSTGAWGTATSSLALGDDGWRAVMRFAATAAALSCTRRGCRSTGAGGRAGGAGAGRQSLAPLHWQRA